MARGCSELARGYSKKPRHGQARTHAHTCACKTGVAGQGRLSKAVARNRKAGHRVEQG